MNVGMFAYLCVYAYTKTKIIFPSFHYLSFMIHAKWFSIKILCIWWAAFYFVGFPIGNCLLKLKPKIHDLSINSIRFNI